MSFPDSDKFLSQTGPVSGDLLTCCDGLEAAPDGFERIWAAFEPMEVMQKRGQIARPRTGEAWQFVCDEGTSLGGSDWAPPPLAFFAAGMAASVLGRLIDRAAELGVAADAVSVETANNYSLKGSILRGTMLGLGHDPDVSVAIEGESLTRKDVAAVAFDAVSSSLAGYLMKSVFVSAFGLTLNGKPVSLDLPDCALKVARDTLPAAPFGAAKGAPAYVKKKFLRPDDPNFDGGTGAGHDPVQNRRNRVPASATGTADGAFRIESGLGRPQSSVFDFLGSGDDGVAGAPSSAVLMAAGIGFCYMTQLGRYAHAVKRPVADYRMIQAIDVPLPGSDGSQTPVIGTKLFVDLDEADADFGRELTYSGKRTCFLHSSLGESLKSRISAR